jgi:cytochrome c biogenesis protein CcmG/thiol:disulfide interchange protein DsbE
MTRKATGYLCVAVVAAALLWTASAYVAHESRRLTDSGGIYPPIQFIRNAPVVPSLALSDLDGGRFSTAAWRDKVTVVNFWATWCPPCRAEIPEFVALQAKYRDELQIVGVSLDEAPTDFVRQFAREHGVNYPIVMVTPELQRAFPGVFALPTSFVLDRDGRVVKRHVGLVSIDIYEREVRALAGLDPGSVIEEIDESQGQRLAGSALATEIPGVDLSTLSSDLRRTAIERLNAESCTCGCGLTLAGCRINDTSCQISLPLAQQLVQDLAASP